MQNITIKQTDSADQAKELDQLLWEVLWKPLDIPRDFRKSITDTECLEYVVKEGTELLGGLIAHRVSESLVELRHLALLPAAQGKSIGRNLVEHFIEDMKKSGCTIIQTTARNTSAGFFEKIGFTTLPGDHPEHPLFMRHGITFLRMEYQCSGQ